MVYPGLGGVIFEAEVEGEVSSLEDATGKDAGCADSWP